MKRLLLLVALALPTDVNAESFADDLTQPQKQMLLAGMLSGVCDIHDENYISDSIAKIYTTQYLNNANNNYLSKSEIELVKSSVLEVYPSCPFPK